MAILPATPRGFWGGFALIVTRPTFRRFLILVGSAILTVASGVATARRPGRRSGCCG